MSSPTVRVAPGTLVYFDEVGLQVRADFNAPEFGSQPYVTINTEDLPAAHRYDEGTGRAASDPPFAVSLLGSSWDVVHADDGGAVASFKIGRPFPFNDPERDAESYASLCNTKWADGVPGVPAVAVHLNDNTLYDDEGDGKGNRHRDDTPKTNRYVLLETLADAVRAALANNEVAPDGAVADALYDFDREAS